MDRRQFVASIGLELYTVRDELARDFEGTLRRVAAIGYREVEFAGHYGRSAEEVRAALAMAGLTAPSAQAPSTDLRLAWAARIEAAKAIGRSYLVCGWVPPAERRSLARAVSPAPRNSERMSLRSSRRAGAADMRASSWLSWGGWVVEANRIANFN